jgi:ABC-type nickel/cobalt efflux system permease component RcnA
MAELTEKN